MKRVINYFINAVAIFLAIVLTTAGGWLSLVGLCLCVLVYVSVLKYPTWWRTFYRTNLRILSHFGLLE